MSDQKLFLNAAAHEGNAERYGLVVILFACLGDTVAVVELSGHVEVALERFGRQHVHLDRVLLAEDLRAIRP